MKLIVTFLSCTFALYCADLSGQWEIGLAGGYGFYKNVNTSIAGVDVETGFSRGPVLSIFGAENLYRHIGGEFRYTLQGSDLQLKATGQETSFEAQSHAFEYDFLFHTAPRNSPVRPYIEVGAGAKLFRGVGREYIYQPLEQYGLLSRTQQVEPLLSAGVGVKINLGRHVQLRLDARDHATPFPQHVIVPARASFGGWLHDIIPSAGIGLVP